MTDISTHLSQRALAIEESKTVRFTPLIQKLRSQGREITDLAVGEPYFKTPLSVLAATKAALDMGYTRYSSVPGLPELRSALSALYRGYDPQDILVANGSKQCLYTAFQALLNPGDEVIIPKPHWVSFTEQVKLCGATPVLADTLFHQLDCDRIEAAVSPRTKILLVNNPNNPTGAVYPPADLQRLAELALKYDFYILSDESYDLFVYDGRPFVSFLELKGLKERLVVTKSFSKTYSMTGFRIGYTLGPQELIQGMARIQSHLSGNACTFAQFGALAGLGMDKGELTRNRDELEKNRDLAFGLASELFDCRKPQGAFYLFPDVSGCLEPGVGAEEFAAGLLDKTGVAVVPGEAFGVANHIRISYAVPREDIERGFERIKAVL